MAELRPEMQEIVEKIKAAKLHPFEVFYLRSLLKPPAGASAQSVKKKTADKKTAPPKKTAPKKTVKAAKKAAPATAADE